MVTREEIKKAVMAVISELFPFLLRGDMSTHLVLLPKTPHSTGQMIEYVKRHGEKEALCFAGYKESERYYAGVAFELDLDIATESASLCAKAADYRKISLVSPSAGMIKALAAADDSIPEVSLVLYALLHKRKVSIVTDFDFTDITPGAFGKQMTDAYAALADMGCEIVRMTTEEQENFDVMAGLLTESAVIEASKKGKRDVVVSKKTVVTPLAKDAAEELGIRIRIK